METLILSTMVTVNVIAICWMVLWASRISTEIHRTSNMRLDDYRSGMWASLILLEEILGQDEKTSSCAKNERSKDTGDKE